MCNHSYANEKFWFILPEDSLRSRLTVAFRKDHTEIFHIISLQQAP